MKRKFLFGGTGPALRLRNSACVLFLLAVLPPAADAYEPAYESLNAANLLSERFLNGPDYEVEPEVVNRGLMNHYQLRTDYGPMTAHSDRKLQQRLQEIRALRELEKINEGMLVAESAGQAVWRTAKSLVRVVRDPVGTAEGVQQGVQRLLRRGSRKLRNAYFHVQDAVTGEADGGGGRDGGNSLSDKALNAGRTFARNRLGVSRAYRNIAREVGVDPYTDNRILSDEMNRLAKHAAGGSLGTKLFIPRIPGIIGAIEGVSDLVWDKDRLDLLLHNEDTLATLPVPEPVARGFIENESFSPTQQTAIVFALSSMKSVANHWRLIEYAGLAETPSEAEFYTNMIGLLALYHEERAALDTIHPTSTMVPAALTDDHRVIVVFPVDLIRWTPSVGEMIVALNASHAGQLEHREIWTTGEVSPQAGRGLVGYGWIPFTHAHQRLAPLRLEGTVGLESRGWSDPAALGYHRLVSGAARR